GGDGDGFSIGSGHIPHVARKNIDITYIVMNNNIYGLTKGQASPTTPLDTITKTTYYGNMEDPINPVRMMISYNSSFVARAFSGYPKETAAVIAQAIAHKGFSFIEVLSPCPTFNGKDQFTMLKEKTSFIDENHDSSDQVAAFDVANSEDNYKLGIIYHKNRPTYTDLVHNLQKKAKGNKPVPEVIDLLKMYEP
ncbi:MAG: 2-oxoacid ferredoxin oxidoreductase, partial [Candidatus Marinimicrobia bacterium]|nr:2-oxoacid ferredoxin oxidoreductase [Candidatus Neomarinimicrobiota bacterium]